MMIYLEKKNGGSSQFATLKKALPGHIQIAKMLVPSLQKIPSTTMNSMVYPTRPGKRANKKPWKDPPCYI